MLLLVEAIELHHLAPSRDEVADELLFRVGGSVDLGEGAQLRMRAEDQVGPGRSPLGPSASAEPAGSVASATTPGWWMGGSPRTDTCFPLPWASPNFRCLQ